eukprot:scaffold120272_cov27-Phaeocystis_antarctica.AAC.1
MKGAAWCRAAGKGGRRTPRRRRRAGGRGTPCPSAEGGRHPWRRAGSLGKVRVGLGLGLGLGL